MSRTPNKITHVYELGHDEIHEMIRKHLGIPQKDISHIEWNAYGDSADAEVHVTITPVGGQA